MLREYFARHLIRSHISSPSNMITLSSPPRVTSESVRGLRGTIDALRDERATMDRFLEESLAEFEELAQGLSAEEAEIERLRESLREEREAFAAESQRLQALADRFPELERQLAAQDQTIAALRDELLQARADQAAAESELAVTLVDLHAAADLVDVVRTWSGELAAVADRLRARKPTEVEGPTPPSGASSSEQTPAPQATAAPAVQCESELNSSDGAAALRESAERESAPPQKNKRSAPSAGKSMDPVVGSVLAQLAELEQGSEDRS